MDKMRMESEDIQQENVKKIAAMFPNCVTEARDEEGHLKKAINFEMLRQMLSDSVIDGDEAYEFSWVGKKASIVEANRPIRKTLRPVKEDSVNWDTTENLYIEGDNLEVLKLLQESYLGKVKIIYIDPPYNTGHDFIYPDSFIMNNEDYDEGTNYYNDDGNVNYKRENTESNGRYHSDWCSMIYSRLLLARNLLSDDGVIFISIDDNEQANIKELCDEIFGNENAIASFPRLATKSGKTPLTFMISHDYVLCYAKSRHDIFIGEAFEDNSYKYSDEFVKERGRYNLKQPLDCNSISYSASLDYPITHDGITYYPGSDYSKYLDRKKGKHLPKDYAWRWSKDLFEFGLKSGWIVFQNGRIYTKGYLNAAIEKQPDGTYSIVRREKTRKMSTLDFISNDYSNDIAKKQLAAYKISARFDFPKPINLIQKLLASHYDKDALVMDFFSGSATTAEATMRQNVTDGGSRKFILIQVPEPTQDDDFKTICDIGKERIRRAAEKIHKDNPEAKFDDGFRVLKLDDTNMKDVYYAAGDYTQDLVSMLESNVKPDRTDLDLLFGCLIEWGLPLSLPYTSETIDGCKVHTYNDGDLIACFDENVPESVIKTIAKRQPLRAVFRDFSFASSPEKINVGEIFKLLAPDTRVKVI